MKECLFRFNGMIYSFLKIFDAHKRISIQAHKRISEEETEFFFTLFELKLGKNIPLNSKEKSCIQ